MNEYSVVDIQRAAAGRAVEILNRVGEIPSDLLDGKHHPCPKCGGTDRFRLIDPAAGAVLCNHCFKNGNGDFLGAVRWSRGVDFRTAIDLVGDHLGIAKRYGDNGQNGNGAVDLIDRVCTAKRMPREALLKFGATVDKRGKLDVVRVPAFGPDGEPSTSFDLSVAGKGWFAKGRPAGVFLPGCKPEPGETWILTEGVKDAAVLLWLDYLACGLPTCKLAAKFAPMFRGAHVLIVPDLDQAGIEGANTTASRLAGIAASVRIARLPGEIVASNGDDVRDVLQKPDGERLVKDAIEAAAEWQPGQPGEEGADEPLPEKPAANEANPEDIAAEFLAESEFNGVPTVRFHQGSFKAWKNGRWVDEAPHEFRSRLVRWMTERFCRITTSTTNNVLDALRGIAYLPGSVLPNTWTDEPPRTDDGEYWPNDGILATQSGLVHLARFVESKPDYLAPLNPRYLNTASVGTTFEPHAPMPKLWLEFLRQLWGDDQDSIDLLQEWFGLLLTPDTSYQKIMVLIGATRSGKGVITRVAKAMLGAGNVASPTLGTLGTPFGLWPLVGKLAAIVSDARLSGRADLATITERLLSISGEDSLDLDRKYLPPLSDHRLTTRLWIVSNELPRLVDVSGALAGRMLLLKLSKSFAGAEDKELTQKLLAELPAILVWSVWGWARLRHRGYFIQPESSQELRDDLTDITSPLSQFLQDCCIIEPGRQSTIDDLYAAWCEWCRKQGRKEPGTAQWFGRDVRTSIPSIYVVRRGGDGNRYRCYEGIGLKTWQ